MIWIGAGDAPNPSKVYSWTKYRNFWKENYSHLKLGTPAEDICNLCHKFAMLHKFSLGKDDQALSDALFRLVDDEGQASETAKRGDGRNSGTNSGAAVKEAEVSAH